MNGDRLGRWIFTVVFALTPPSLASLFFWQDGRKVWRALSEAPEVGFTAIMLSATVWSEVREARDQMPQTTLIIGEYAFILLTIASAVIYGSHSKSLYLNPGEVDFRQFLANITVTLSLAALVVGTIYQVLLARVEG